MPNKQLRFIQLPYLLWQDGVRLVSWPHSNACPLIWGYYVPSEEEVDMSTKEVLELLKKLDPDSYYLKGQQS